MNIFNKIKSIIYEEQIIEEKVEEPIVEKKIQREEIKPVIHDNIISEREFIKKEENFKFPVIFEDEDIKEEVKEEKIEKPKPVERPSYVKPKLDREVIREVIEKPKKFTVSPVISPIYGILDKNYKKDEVSEKSDDKYKTKEMVINFDTIRQKAFGSLEDELTDIIEGNKKEKEKPEAIVLEKEVITENDLLDNLKIKEDTTRVKNNNDMYDFDDFGVEYKIDDSGDKPKHGAKKIQKKKQNEDIAIDAQEEKKEVEITDDLFNLIDSMYDN